MEINATLFGQLITFVVLVWFTLKYVWPPITKAMQERDNKIAAGIDAAERSQRELTMAGHKVMEMLREARQEATNIVNQAHQRAAALLEEGRESAQQESQQIVKRAEGQIASEVAQTREALRQQLAGLAVLGAEKILGRQLDAAGQAGLLDEFVAEI